MGLQRAPPAAPARPTTTPTQKSGGMLSGIGSTIAQGMAFGTGSAIAHQAVGAAVNSMSGGGSHSEKEPVLVEEMSIGHQKPSEMVGPCAQDKQMFFDCLKHNQGDQQACSFLYETLNTCQSNQSQMNFQ